MQLPDLPIGAGLAPSVRRSTTMDGRSSVLLPAPARRRSCRWLCSTQAWRSDGKIVMLEPRRLAARAAARRMADLTGTHVGDLVGYQTRDERRIGPTTRIEVLTEGVLTRRLQDDPELPGVAAVIFDEVHERNLPTDLGLALILEVAATVRPDLRILAMSATADTARFARLLAPASTRPAPIISVDGRQHPVEIRWLPRQRNDRLDDAVDQAVLRALAENESGDVLVFLPGIGEILRCRDRLAGKVGSDVDIRPLAGALSVEEQDLALAPSPVGRRRVVLATDIAETSLTVEGVRVVIDSGLVRSPRFDPATGMTSLDHRVDQPGLGRSALWTGGTRPSRASPTDCGRRSSTAPGRRTGPPRSPASTWPAWPLEVAAWGTPIEDLAFPDPPPRSGVEGRARLAADPRGDRRGRQAHRRRPADGRTPTPSAPRPHRRRGTVVDGVRRRHARRRARRPARAGR